MQDSELASFGENGAPVASSLLGARLRHRNNYTLCLHASLVIFLEKKVPEL